MDKYRIRWVEYRGISKLIMENFAEGSNLAEVCKDAFGKIVYDLRRQNSKFDPEEWVLFGNYEIQLRDKKWYGLFSKELEKIVKKDPVIKK